MLTSCGSDQDPDADQETTPAAPSATASASATASPSADDSPSASDSPGATNSPGATHTPAATASSSSTANPTQRDQSSAESSEQPGTKPISGDFNTELRESEDFPGGSTSGDQQLIAVRSGVHDGFDRVVFEFSGEDLPSWRAEYVDAAAELGRGNRIEMAGEAILQIHVSGPSWLPEDEVEDSLASGEYYERDSAALLEEVYIQGPFEALSQYLIGLPEEVPFSVELLEDPTRLVVDLATRNE